MLVALWFWECLAVLPPGGACASFSGRRLAGMRLRAGLFLANPWPARFAFLLDGSPYEATAEHVIGAGPLSFLAATGAAREQRAVAWSAVVEARGVVVRMGDSPLLRASSEASAARLCAELRALAQAPANERLALARERLRALLASDELAAQIARVRRATLAHRSWTVLAIGAVFSAPPLLALGVGTGWSSVWERFWPACVALHAVGFAALLGAELALGARDGRFARLLHAAIYPPSQWRGSFALASAALCDVHPLAVQRVFGGEPALLRSLRSAIAECDYPRFDAGDADAEPRRAALRERRAVLAEFAAAAGLAAELAAPPQPREAVASSYCPRCFEEFVAAGWVCTDCGLETQRYGARG